MVSIASASAPASASTSPAAVEGAQLVDLHAVVSIFAAVGADRTVRADRRRDERPRLAGEGHAAPQQLLDLGIVQPRVERYLVGGGDEDLGAGLDELRMGARTSSGSSAAVAPTASGRGGRSAGLERAESPVEHEGRSRSAARRSAMPTRCPVAFDA
jgi:hypothetical protein